MIGTRSKQALEFTFGQPQTFESLQEVFPSRLYIRRLLQELPGPLEAVRTRDIQPVYEGSPDPAVPVQPPKKFLIDRHWDHIREALVSNWKVMSG